MAVRKMRKSWWVDFRWRHVRYRKRSPLNTKWGAETYEVTLRTALARGEDVNMVVFRSITFEEFSTRWFQTHVCTSNKPSDQRAKRSILKRHLLPVFGKLPLSQIRKSTIEEFKARQVRVGLNRKSINNHLAVLSKCLRSALEWDVIGSVPRIGMLKTTPPTIDVLDHEELSKLLDDDSEPMWNTMIRLALKSGLRRGELIAIQWRDIDFIHRKLAVQRSIVDGIVGTPKNGRTRYVPLLENTIADLERLRLPQSTAEDYVFQSRGRSLSGEQMSSALSRICKRLSIRRIGWHKLRHTFATELAARGVPLHVVQELLGHSTITMTMRYAHVAPSMLHDAVARLEERESMKVN